MSKYTEAMDQIEKGKGDVKNQKSLLSYPETDLKLSDSNVPFFKRKIIWLIGGLALLFVLVLILGVKREKPSQNIPLSEMSEEQSTVLSVGPEKVVPVTGAVSGETLPAASTEINTGFDSVPNTAFDETVATDSTSAIPPSAGLAGSAESATLPDESISGTVQPQTAQSAAAELTSNYYTLQLITYGTEVRAKEEAKKLEGKGLQAFVLPMRKFFTICIGRYADKNEAEQQLTQFKATLSGKLYSDAYIRFVGKS